MNNDAPADAITQADIEAARSICGLPADQALRKQLQDARGSLYQCYRSSRDDALESHPDWAEHIADINRESGEAIARIDEALKGKS